MAGHSTSRCRLCPTREAGDKRQRRAAVVALALVLCAGPWASAQSPRLALRFRSAQPGELVAVRVSVPVGATGVSVRAFGVEWPAIQENDTVWRALVGIDLEVHPGRYPVVATITAPAASVTRDLTVTARRFRTRTLTVAPDYVNPPPDILTRITDDAALMAAAYAQVSPTPHWQHGFIRPVPDRTNSSFGTRSVFNGEPRSPHAGTDFLSRAGTQVHAPAGGRIVVARDLFFTGHTVVIDHGLGVFSMLAHLSRLDVGEDDEVDGGAVVGLVGATGRVTGPHLHWALRVGPARVDAVSALALLGDGR